MATQQRTIKEMAQDSSLHEDIEDYSEVSRWFIRIDKDGDRREIFVEQTEEEHDNYGTVAYTVAFVYSDSNRFFQDTDVRQNADANGKAYPLYEQMTSLRAAELMDDASYEGLNLCSVG